MLYVAFYLFVIVILIIVVVIVILIVVVVIVIHFSHTFAAVQVWMVGRAAADAASCSP